MIGITDMTVVLHTEEPREILGYSYCKRTQNHQCLLEGIRTHFAILYGERKEA